MNSYYTDPHQNPYWQKLNRDPSENNSGQGTFEQDPNWHPQPEYGRQLGRTAAFIGVFSIGTTIFFPIFVPIIFGSIAIVLAIISKGKQESFTHGARQAVMFGTISLVINFLLLAACIVFVYLLLHDAAFRTYADSIVQQLYGYSVEDLLQQLGLTPSAGGIL